jgi:ABC-type branched-subunit amino acid transport system ATPase component
LTGVLRPTSGRILLDQRDITAVASHRRVKLGIARTFQINQLFGDLTPLETVSLAVSERMGMGRNWWRLLGSRAQLTDEVAEILESFRLTDVMDERTAILPYGKQRPARDRGRRWRAARACCCSTSRRPACRRTSGMSSSASSPPCRPTYRCC